MKNKRNLLQIFSFVVLIIFLIIGFIVINNSVMNDTLRKEILSLKKLDVKTDRYNKSLKTIGKYRVVEGTIKSYLDEFASLVQDIDKMMNDDKLKKLLSYDNYSKDSPEFKESLSYIEESKKTFNDKIDRLLVLINEDNVKNEITKKTKNKKIIELYNELMQEVFISNEMFNNSSYEPLRVSVNNIYDVSNSVFNFLITNKDLWVLEDGEIKFQTKELYDQYMQIVSGINKKQEE